MAVRKTKAGLALKRWFKEDWRDQRTGKKCGRQKGEKRGTPYCRPSKRVSSKTPKTGSEMTKSEKRKRIAQKIRLGQPAGKPRRVQAARRRKKKQWMITKTLKIKFVKKFVNGQDMLQKNQIKITTTYPLSLIHI